MNLPPLQADARLRIDIKATATIAITITTYIACYVPAILIAVLGLQKRSLAEPWFGFITCYSLYISSAVNPVIYCLRTSRFRTAFRQFFKHSFGSNNFKGTPSHRVRRWNFFAAAGNEERQLHSLARSRNDSRKRLRSSPGISIHPLSIRHLDRSQGNEGYTKSCTLPQEKDRE